jgi:UDPglucose--hexose-1-phosphate uridylyltransferase
MQESLSEQGVCPMCLVINTELGGPRQIIATEFYVGFCPWASANAFEFWIFPRRHQTSFLKITQKEISDLALALRASLGGLASLLKEPPFNLVFHLSSEKKTTKQLHWHIEVYPNINSWAGLERGSGVFVNPVPPEQAAQLLTQKIRGELGSLSDSL